MKKGEKNRTGEGLSLNTNYDLQLRCYKYALLHEKGQQWTTCVLSRKWFIYELFLWTTLWTIIWVTWRQPPSVSLHTREGGKREFMIPNLCLSLRHIRRYAAKGGDKVFQEKQFNSRMLWTQTINFPKYYFAADSLYGGERKLESSPGGLENSIQESGKAFNQSEKSEFPVCSEVSGKRGRRVGMRTIGVRWFVLFTHRKGWR